MMLIYLQPLQFLTVQFSYLLLLLFLNRSTVQCEPLPP